MDFLKRLIYRKDNFSESVVLIDVGSEYISGAYSLYKNDEIPQLLYAIQLSIKPHKSEEQESALIRTLKVLCDDLIKKGSPTLVRATGSGTVDRILISFDSPIQETVVRTEMFEEKKPFIFTRSLVIERLKNTIIVPKGKVLADESIVGTILNGYVTHNPYGNKVHRASITVLTSLIKKLTIENIVSIIKSSYNSKDMLSISGDSLRYQVIHSIFSHEQNALILDDTNDPTTSISLIRMNILTKIIQVDTSSDDGLWVSNITKALSAIAKDYLLPRTIFIITNTNKVDSVRKKLDEMKLIPLWLSENPPKIIPVLKSHLTNLIQLKGTTDVDLPILFMAIYYKHYRLINGSGKDMLL